MIVLTLEIEARDPLVFRDARPFSADPGALAQTLPFPLPSTTTGAVRSHLVRTAAGFDGWSNPTWSSLALEIAVQGPVLARRSGDAHIPYFPSPADALIVVNEDRDPGDHQTIDGCGVQEEASPTHDIPSDPRLEIHALRPFTPTAGGIFDPPYGLLPLSNGSERKAFSAYRYWSRDALVAWLHSPDPDPATSVPPRQHTLAALRTDTRYHVAIDPARGTNVDGSLFGTVGLVFEQDWTLLVRAMAPEDSGITAPERLTPLGGEGRLATIRQAPNAWPDPPDATAAAAHNARGLRLMLATPAVFDRGFLPSTIDPDTREGTIPNLPDGPRVKLTSVALPRRIPISGWNYRPPAGPKPIRYAAPAGAVYFFEVIDGSTVDRALLDTLWLHPVCDQPDDNRIGYGLAVPGIWHAS